MEKEKEVNPISGYIMVAVVILLSGLSLFGLIAIRNPFFVILLVTTGILCIGFFFINPNESMVLTLFGEYKGTAKTNGFYWVNPFYIKNRISLRARNFDSERVKVNDKVGNPILISVILVWRARNTYKAAFDVDDYESFVRIQCDASVRELAGMYPYDNFEDDDSEMTLRSGLEEVNNALEENISRRLEIEGAVSMVEMALEDLSNKNIIELDEERRAAMVSNLMVVLCSDKDVSPVVNAGSLYN